jgi:phosphoglycolate phosphatase
MEVSNKMPSRSATPAAVLFDLDGTLLDTAKDLGNALNHVLASCSRPPIPFRQYRNIASDGAKGLLELGFGMDIKDYDFALLRQQFLDHYQENICVDTTLFMGVQNVIETLQENDIPWGIVTNKPGWLTDLLLPHFSAFDQCQVVISGDTLTQRKPHPLPLIYAAEQLNVEPGACWYVGDAQRDIEAANAANMVSVLARYGYVESHLPIASWNADLEISKAEILLQHI